MEQTDPPSKVASNDQLGAADEAQPLLGRLRLQWPDMPYPRDTLHREAADEIERLTKYAAHCDELIAAYKATSMTEQRVRELVVEGLVKLGVVVSRNRMD